MSNDGEINARSLGRRDAKGEMREGIPVNPLKNLNPIPSFLSVLAFNHDDR